MTFVKRYNCRFGKVVSSCAIKSSTSRAFCTTFHSTRQFSGTNDFYDDDFDDMGGQQHMRQRRSASDVEALRAQAEAQRLQLARENERKYTVDYYEDPNKPGTARMEVNYRELGENYWTDPSLPAFGKKQGKYSHKQDVLDYLNAAKNAFKQQYPEVPITDDDIKQTFQEWYLRKLESNKWNHFTNQVISSRHTRPWEWDNSDPLPDWLQQHTHPMQGSFVKERPKQGRGAQTPNKLLGNELSPDGTSSLGDFGTEYTKMLSNDFVKDIHSPYLESSLKALNLKLPNYEANSFNPNANNSDDPNSPDGEMSSDVEFDSGVGGATGWEEKSGQLREFFDNFYISSDYQMDSSTLPFVHDGYYDPNPPLPAYRNHEALLTSDPRNPAFIERGATIEEEKAIMLKQGLKLHKRQQDQTGVAYTPDFDFDLWSEDANRPQSPINTYGYLPVKSSTEVVVQRRQLAQRIRMPMKDYAPASDNLIEFRWRSRMTRMIYQPSRAPTFTVITIVGNGRGCAGLAFGSASTYDGAARKADLIARHNMIYIPRYRNHTLSHTLHAKFNSLQVVIEPKPLGYGERGPPIIKAVCHAFGIRDFSARFIGKRRVSNFTKIRCIWKAFFRVTNPTLDCEDRGQRLIECYPEIDGISYQLPRGWSHDNVQFARKILQEHEKNYEFEEGFSQYSIDDEDKKKLPLWIVDEAPDFWEGGMPDISSYKWRSDLIDILNQKGPAGIPEQKEKQIQRLLAEKIDPCDHHFRWMRGMIKTGPVQTLGM